MAWYYVDAGAQKGPFEEERFRELVTTGVIRADTLVWREGMKDWTAYGVVAAGAHVSATTPPAAMPAAPGTVSCGECGRNVPEAETVEIGGRRICASCKPTVVQRMIEGASGGGAMLDPEEMVADLRSQGGYNLDIGVVASRAWETVKGNFWPCVGVNLLILVILGASGQVPCVGLIATLLATGPLMGGLFHYFLLQLRGQPATVNDAFAGFKNPLAKELMLAGLVQQLIQAAVIMVVVMPLILMGALSGQPTNPEDFPTWILLAMPPVFVVAMFTYIIWYPSYIIIADTGLGFWKGMELSRRIVMMRFFTWVGLLLVMMLIGLAGLIALCVGLLVAFPMINAMFAAAWDEIRTQADEVRKQRAGQTA